MARGEGLEDRETLRTTTLKGEQEQKGEGHEQGEEGSRRSTVGCSPSRKKGAGSLCPSAAQGEGPMLTDDPAPRQLLYREGGEQRQGWEQEEATGLLVLGLNP